MKDEAEKMNKKKQNREYSNRDIIVYLIASLLMILLTASFVIENVYSNSDSIQINTGGVRTIYESCIGEINFSSMTDISQ